MPPATLNLRCLSTLLYRPILTFLSPAARRNIVICTTSIISGNKIMAQHTLDACRQSRLRTASCKLDGRRWRRSSHNERLRLPSFTDDGNQAIDLINSHPKWGAQVSRPTSAVLIKPFIRLGRIRRYRQRLRLSHRQDQRAGLPDRLRYSGHHHGAESEAH